jgi:tetratricopeptide (TPR) repeat protein
MNPAPNHEAPRTWRHSAAARSRMAGAGPRAAFAALVAAVAIPALAQDAQPPAAGAPPAGTTPAAGAPPAAVTSPANAATEPTQAPAKPAAAPARKPNRAVPLNLDALLEKVARYPDNAYLVNEVGNQLLLHGRRKDAEERFERAVKLDPDFAAAWNNLGVVRLALDKKTEAAAAYRRALKIQPNYALAWYNLGVTLDRQNLYDESLKAYETAFVLDPGLLDVKKNPQVVTNKRIAAVMSQTYIDRGGTVVFPLESSYP